MLSAVSAPEIYNYSSWTSVSAGSIHTAAIDINGSLYAWGLNSSGQVGYLTAQTSYTIPTKIAKVGVVIPSWSKATAMGGGGAFAAVAAIRANGTLWTWGSGNGGQLGSNATASRSSPVQVGTSSWTQLAGGISNVIAIDSVGGLYAWGTGQQNGLNSTLGVSSPTKIGTSSWTMVSILDSTAGAIDSLGRLFTWGTGVNGQLGDNTAVSKSSPVLIASGTSWSFIAMGGTHSAGITNLGALYTWGRGNEGQLGDGTTVTKSSPVKIGSSSWSKVAAGVSHTNAIDITGALWGWGGGAGGQMGDGTVLPKSTPVKLGSSSWSVISAGTSHSAGITTTGALFTWGTNSNGQLGSGTTINRSSPVQVGTSSWAAVTCGQSHTTAIDAAGNLYVWGQGTAGAIGDNTVVSKSSPVQVGPYSYNEALNIYGSWSAVSAGGTHTVAIDAVGALYVWGLGTSGQLGDGTTVNKLSPIQIASGTSWTSVSAGDLFTTAVSTANTAYAWGFNSAGQLGDGTTVSKSAPVLISGFNTIPGYNSILFNATNQYVTAASNAGFNFGSGNFTIEFWANRTTAAAQQMPISNRPNAAATPNGSWWIDNNTTNLIRVIFGDTNSATQYTISSSTNWPAINTWFHFAVVRNGTTLTAYLNGTSIGSVSVSTTSFGLTGPVYLAAFPDSTAWSFPGYISNVRIVKGTAVYTGTFTPDTTPLTAIANTVLLTAQSGTFVDNGPNNVTITTTNNPIISGISLDASGRPPFTGSTSNTAPIINAGGSHTSAIGYANALYMWGLGTSGQLGDRTIISKSTPTLITVYNEQLNVYESWSVVSAGSTHTAAIDTAGELYTWGLNNNGQLGDGTTVNKFLPVKIGTSSWSAVSAGILHTVGVDSVGNLFTWGLGTSGQLGDNTLVSKSSPVIVTPGASYSTNTYSTNSVFFNGTNKRITADNAGFAFGTGPFCVEAWIYNSILKDYGMICTTRPNNSAYADAWHIGMPGANGSGSFFVGSTGYAVFPAGTIKVGQWQHVAVCRDSNSLVSIFVDGLRVGTQTVAINFTRTLLGIGDFPTTSAENINGYISNLRIVKGSSVYDPTKTTITVPSAPLTAIANTVLLTCQSDTIVDNSGNNIALTNLNNAAPVATTISTLVPTFLSWSAVSAGGTHTAAITKANTLYTWGLGTSGQLGDNSLVTKSTPVQIVNASTNPLNTSVSFNSQALITINPPAILNLANVSWTVECWVYPTGNYGTYNTIFCKRDNSASRYEYQGYLRATTGVISYFNGVTYESDTTLVPNTWSHCAWVHNGTTLRIYVNGINVYTVNASANDSGAPFTIGAFWSGSGHGEYFFGNISNLRVVKGTQVYTRSIAATTLIGISNRTAVLDVASNRTITVVNGVAPAGFNPFGNIYSGSLLFPSTGYLNFGNDTTTNAFQSNNFTIEGWFYHTSTNVQQQYWYNYDTGAAGAIYFGKHANYSGQVTFWSYNVDSFAAPLLRDPTVPPTNAWIHYAVVRNGSSFNLYRNGVSVASATYAGSITGATNVREYVGTSGATAGFIGYLSNFRIVNGTAVYTSDFTPSTTPLNLDFTSPTEPLTAIANTSLLICQSNPIADRSGNNLAFTNNGAAPVSTTNVPFAATAGDILSWSAVSAGGIHSAAVTSANNLFVWGGNTTGQLGDQSTTSKSSPVVTSIVPYTFASTSWTSVMAGVSHLGAITSTGALYAWGLNASGQLGDGTTVSKSLPIQIGSSSWSKISAGLSHTTAIDTTGELFTWGGNTLGQIGDGTTINKSSPVQVGYDLLLTDTSFNLISSGSGNFSYGRGISGNLYSWGNNNSNQLGVAGGGFSVLPQTRINTANTFTSPVSVWSKVSLGAAHTLAIDTSGGLWTWGLGTSGQLGDSTTSSKSSPVKIGTSSWTYVKAGPNFSSAIDINGRLFCWSNNDRGNPAYNNTVITSPILIGASYKIVGTSVGSGSNNQTWWLTSNGIANYQGYSVSGEKGDGSSGNFGSSGGQPTTGSSWTIIGVGGQTYGGPGGYVVGITITGALYAWGSNNAGALGDGTTAQKPVWTNKIGNSSWTYVDAGNNYNTVGIDINGRLFCWGDNTYGQLGDGTTVSKSSPIQIGTSSWSAVSAYYGAALAIDTTGRLYAWGLNSSGQLGTGDTINRSSPVQIGVSKSNWVTVSTGQGHSAAIDNAGALYTWGLDSSGQLGNLK